MHENSLRIFNKYARARFRPGMRVLEIGPRIPSEFQEAVADPSIHWETIDIYRSEKLTYVAEDMYAFPIPDQTYDLVFSANVIEHVRAPWRWMPEVVRVCKIGGTVITINPVNWGFHQFPVDCWRVYPDGMRALYEENGLEPEVLEFGSFESARNRFNWPGVKWLLKQALRKDMYGQPFFPIDNIGIGRRVR
jgi:SAM-dependent methyltransferase